MEEGMSESRSGYLEGFSWVQSEVGVETGSWES